MLISSNRIKKYIKNSEDIDFKEVWSKFTIRTAEIERVYDVGNNFDNVVIAEILTCVEHPDSDHMHVLTVDIGEKDPIQVVCGAPNVRVGLKTTFVKVGGHIDGFEIKAKPLRGVESFGMCCSGRELNISDDHNGIIELPSDAPVGMDIKKYLPIEDIIVEIDNKSLTNRPDLWGHYGIAREVAALTNHELLSIDLIDIPNDKKDLDIIIKNPDLCKRYCGLTVENIQNNKTPLEMQIFLYYVGMRSISLLVDLTNFVMLELGQPMHAFDMRVVKNIEVDVANDGDTYTTLDGVERKLTKDILMIKNGQKYFGIAGIMGGLDSEILDDTTSVFIESANFDAGVVRKGAVSLGLRTEASARYEKSLDPNLTDIALRRMVYLLKQENPEIEISSNLTDIYPSKLDICEIILTKEKLSTYMGKSLDNEIVESILKSLGFKVETKNDKYIVTVPTFRHSKDINIPEDLIEEIARIYGFENIESESLSLPLYAPKLESVFEEEYNVKRLLANKYNLHEVHSYLWYDTEFLNKLGISKEGVKLLTKNEDNVLRDDLSLSLLNICNNNFKIYNEFNIFEIGTTIVNGENRRFLSIVLCNEEKNTENVYNLAKEIVKYLFKVQKNKDIFFEKTSCEEYYEKSLSKSIIVNDSIIGSINVVNNKYVNKISKKKVIVAVDIDFDKFINVKTSSIKLKEISKYPFVSLDYTVITNNNEKYQDILNILNGFKNKFIKDLCLVGIYENKYTFRYTVGSNNKTLDQNDLVSFKESFIKHVKDNGLNIVE